MKRLSVRHWFWSLLLVLAAVACDGSSEGDGSPFVLATTVDREAGFPTAVGTVSSPDLVTSAAGDSLDVASIDALLASLESYRWELAIGFSGEGGDGSPVEWRLTNHFTSAARPLSRRSELNVEGLAASAGPQSLTMVQTEDGSFMSVPGVGCVSTGSEDVDLFENDLADPDHFLAGMSGARLESTGDSINGIRSYHYRFDERALPLWQGQPVSVDGHIYVAAEGGYVSRVTLEATGEADFLSQGAVQDGRLQLELNVLDVNQPLKIGLPDGCQSQTSYPMMDDAFGITSLDGLVSYRSSRPLAEVVAFYQAEMPRAGWVVADEEVIFDDLAFLTFSKDGLVITINIEQDDEDQTVTVLISP